MYYGYRLIGAAFVAQFVAVGALNYAAGAFMTPMTDELGWTRAEFILPRSLGQFVMAFTGFLIGAQVDRRGARPLMLVGLTTLTIALLAHAHIDSLWQWVVLNGVVLTVGAALLGNLVVNVTLAKWFVEKRGQAIAWSSMGVSFAGIVITPTITWFIDAFGWRAAWQAMALATFVMTLPVALAMRRAPEDHGLHPDGKSAAQIAAGHGARAQADFDSSVTRGEALRMRTFYLLVFAFGLFQVVIPVVLLQTIPFMTDAGYSRTTAAFMIAIASIPALVSKPLWGYLIDRMNPKPLAAMSALCTGIAMAMIVFSVQARAEFWEYVAFFVLGLGWGGMIPLQEVIWASYFGRRHLGAVRSAALPFTLILGAGGPLAVAYYYDVVGSYDGAFLAVAASCVVSAGLLLALPRAGQRAVAGGPSGSQPGAISSGR
ncbi:MAG: MFS transporter [Pseudomonadales bacterium]|nr:MFS transporter [Pseudomonadales bacterium]